MVLPVPGGPNKRTPLTASAATPSWYKRGYFKGYVMHCRRTSFTDPRPPIISQVTPISCGEITFVAKACCVLLIIYRIVDKSQEIITLNSFRLYYCYNKIIWSQTSNYISNLVIQNNNITFSCLSMARSAISSLERTLGLPIRGEATFITTPKAVSSAH